MREASRVYNDISTNKNQKNNQAAMSNTGDGDAFQPDAVPPSDPYQTYLDSAHEVIETLNGVLHPAGHQIISNNATNTGSTAYLELILNMIQANLTFDDPGIFFGCSTPHQRARRMQLHFNVWLHHQIVYVIVRHNGVAGESLRRKAYDLQLEMLAASLLKQRWLFRKIVERYAHLLRALCEDLDWSHLPYTVWSSKATENGSEIDEDDDTKDQTDDSKDLRNAPNRSHIQIDTLAQREALANNCIHLLTQSVVMCANTDVDLVRLAAESVMSAFVVVGLAGKTEALQFVAKLLRCRINDADDELDSARQTEQQAVRLMLHDIVSQVILGVQQICQRLPVLQRVQQNGVCDGDTKRFIATVLRLLSMRELPVYCTDESSYGVCVQVCCSFLISGLSVFGEDCDENNELRAAVIMFFGKVVRLNETVDFCRDLSALFAVGQCGRRETSVLQLLRSSVADRLTDRRMATSADVEQHAVWQLLDDLVDGVFDRAVQTERVFIDRCCYLKSLIKMLLSAEHDFQVCHQKQHLNGSPDFHTTCSVCQSGDLLDDWECYQFFHFNNQLRQTHRRLNSIMSNLTMRFLRFVADRETTAVVRTIDGGGIAIADVAWCLFGNRHARLLPESEQQKLLALAMCTLLPADSPERRDLPCPSLDATLREAKSTNLSTVNSERLIDTILSTNLHGLSKVLRTALMQMFAAIAVPLRLETRSLYALWKHIVVQADVPLNDVLTVTVERLDRGPHEIGDRAVLVAQLLRTIVCTAGGRTFSVSNGETMRTKLHCIHCSSTARNVCEPAITVDGLIHRNRANEGANVAVLRGRLLRDWLPLLFGAEAVQTRLDVVDALAALAVHVCEELARDAGIVWLSLIGKERVGMVQMCLVAAMPTVLAHIKRSTTISARDRRLFFEQLLDRLTAAVEASLIIAAPFDVANDVNEMAQRQADVVSILTAVGTHAEAAEVTVLQCILLAIVFMVRVESTVAKTAALCIFEICERFGTTVRKMVAWHQERVFELLVASSVANCLQYGLGLHTTLRNFCNLLGYQNLHSSFMPHHSGILLALLLPWRQRHVEVAPLLEELYAAQNRTQMQVVSSAFLQVYPHLCLREWQPEEAGMREACVRFLLESSGHELVYHLKADIQRTLNEILVWYHRDPKFVMQTLQLLDNNAGGSTAPQPLAVIREYIGARFLGVLHYFDVVLVANDLEKCLQAEVLLSLGDIIRFMGAAHITRFRFKILTVLRSVLAIENRQRLRDICASVWKIFVCTVDVQALGPLLSIVVVYLEPLMRTHATVVNEILHYLIIENGSLLSMHIEDLFFIERTGASPEIREHVARHTRDVGSFESRFRLFGKQIVHENIDVRVYGLQYLSELFDGDRAALNELIVGQPALSPQVEQLLGSLLAGCRHADAQLQLSAGRCLGKIGALEPGHLPPNYAPQKRLALGIHSDTFAIMALAELCRAYQFQKDTKLVDVFSLAIQEILLARGVCPEKNLKLNVWNAIPERMRQLMQPLLKSCYAALPANVTHTAHPIFHPGRFASAEAWACAWATRLTESIADEHTKHLLKSFRTSLRNDAGVLTAFMPYVVLHAVQTANEANALRIEEELHCVFRSVQRDSENGQRGSIDSGAIADAGVDEVMTKCAKIAFNQLEFLGCWLRQFREVYANAADADYGRVKALLERFDAKLLASANFRCGEFARALQYLEMYVEEAATDSRVSMATGGSNTESRLQDELTFLARIYAELVDTDALAGALNMKAGKPTLDEQVLLHTATGRLQESTVCFEQMMQLGAMTDSNAVHMIQCYLGLDQPETALMVADALMQEMHDRIMPSAMYACSAEALWRLGRFEELDDLLVQSKQQAAPDWGIRCGQLMLAWRKGGLAEFEIEIDRCQMSVLRELQTHDGDEHGSYDKVYPLMLRLHQIAEIQMCQAMVEDVVASSTTAGATVSVVDADQKALQRLFGEWDARLELLQPTAKIQEPVLCLRRILLNETKELLERNLNGARATSAKHCAHLIDTYIGASLMRSTELACAAEMYQQSQLFILNAESYSPPTLFIAKAKLAWSKGDQAVSLSILERGIETLRGQLDDAKTASRPEENVAREKVFAEAKFLVATYSADSMNTNTTLTIRYFKEAMKAAGNSEKCYVFYAQYMEKIYGTLSASEQSGSRGNESQQEIMTCYGKSMSYGCRYIYQSMPRFLSIWLDFTARQSTANATSSGGAAEAESCRRIAQNMTKIVDHFAEVLPSFVFFTAFSQLVSRICHPSADVYQTLKTIIIKLIKNYTQQSMWMIMSVYKSSYASRVKRCTEVFSDRRLAARDMQKLIKDFTLLAERMIELTNRPVSNPAVGEPALTVSAFYKELPALLRSPGFSPIILPTNKYMLPVLPGADQRDRPASSFNAFPNQAVYIAGCQNELVVMPSLQKPKRITLIGNDGHDYMIMMKPKDDLRKDFRLMEFNAIVNRYLRQDAEARQRRLRIRTYAVLPLNEECGIIEWLANLQALRPIVMDHLKRKSLGVGSRELRELYRPARDAAAKRQLLIGVLIPRHPPQLADWYKERFSTAHNWYLARCSYVRTTAVISMVGYILGLGDRHGENILFDTSNGDTVHVDFNCLFNKGECFEVPELVPFRLTHNMVHAMGPLGVEGGYRQCSQITLRVLREQLATLMSVLRPFVYDPLVSWNRVMSKTDGRQERTDTQAITNVQRIEERLRGFVKQNGVVGTMVLSCEGVVNHCVAEATDVDKLAAMYMGWGPFI